MISYIPEFQQGNRNHQPHSSKDVCLAKSYPSCTIVHPKLEMTEPGDADEQEADVAANEVMSGKVFRKFSGGGAGGGVAVSSQMESQLNQLQGGGQAMPDGLRGMMERGFDRDFSQVRLHTDGEAAGLSSSIHAKAFTHGNDIYFNQGQYAPETSEGQRLVAHELTHVAQGGGKVGRDSGDTIRREPTTTSASGGGSCEELPQSNDMIHDAFNSVASNILDMREGSDGFYRAILDCIQRYFGYMEEYDIILSYFTSAQRKKFFFSYNNSNYCIWAWKGDYLNLGIGAELGIYTGEQCNKDDMVCLSDSNNLTMEMAVTKLQYGDHTYCMDSSLKSHFWATAFAHRNETQYFSIIIPIIAKLIQILVELLSKKTGVFSNESVLFAISSLKNDVLSLMRTKIDGRIVNSADMIAEYTIKYKESQDGLVNSFIDTNPAGWTFDKNSRLATFSFKGKGDSTNLKDIPFLDYVDAATCARAIERALNKVFPVIINELSIYYMRK